MNVYNKEIEHWKLSEDSLNEIHDLRINFAIQQIEKIKSFADASYSKEVVMYCKDIIETLGNQIKVYGN